MKKLTLILLSIVMIVTLAACGDKKCDHAYDNACDVTCNECGEERTITHDWNDATCLTPKTCKVCGATDGEALGHDWMAADCESARSCPSAEQPTEKSSDILRMKMTATA